MKSYEIVLLVLLIIILLFVFIFYLLIAPGRKKQTTDLSWIKEKLISHRGYFDNKEIYENSLSAFMVVIEKHYNIETDISLTKDEQLIIFHDDDLLRLFNNNQKINELTLDEIRQYSYPNGDKILTLEEFLNFVNGQADLFLELKMTYNQKDYILCQKVCDALRNYKGHYAIISFSPFILRYFKKHFPFVARGQLYTKFNLKEVHKQNKNLGFQGYIDFLSKWFYNMKLVNFIGRPHFFLQEIGKQDFTSTICYLLMPKIIFTIKNKEQFNHFINKTSNLIIENIEVDNYG